MRFLFIFLLLPAVSEAQCNVSQTETGEVITTCTNQYNGKYTSTHIRQYGGSPYLGVQQWHDGSLLLANGHIQPVTVSIDIYNNILKCLMPDSTNIVVEAIREFYVEDKRFIIVQREKLPISQPLYYQVLYDGSIRLLKKYSQQLKLNKSNSSFNQKSPFDLDGYFETTVDYYYQDYISSVPKQFIPKRKIVYALFSQTYSGVDKNEKVSEAELINLFRSLAKDK